MLKFFQLKKKNLTFNIWNWLFRFRPLDGAFALCHGAAEKVEVLHLLHCLSKGTGSGSAARFNVIPSLPGSLTQSSAMATAGRLLSGASSI